MRVCKPERSLYLNSSMSIAILFCHSHNGQNKIFTLADRNPWSQVSARGLAGDLRLGVICAHTPSSAPFSGQWSDEFSVQTLSRKLNASLLPASPRAEHFLFAPHPVAGCIQCGKPPDATLPSAMLRQSYWMRFGWRLAAAFPANLPRARSRWIIHRAGHCARPQRACHGNIPIKRKRAQTRIIPRQDRARNDGL